jgi:hypothetical protein
MNGVDLNRVRVERECRARGRGLGVAVVAAVSMVLAVTGPAHAGEGEWSLRLEALFMNAYGHDQHVLTIHEIDLGAMPPVDDKTGVNLETDSGLTYRGEFRYTRGQWAVGVDLFWFVVPQGAPNLSAAADGPDGTIDLVSFEIADRSHTSMGPDEVLYYSVLEDTDLAMWTADLYGLRTLAEGEKSKVKLQFGLRFADFDNDYRAVVGVEGVGGTRLDASSNYGLMMGPIVGLAGEFDIGRSRIVGYLGQSLVFGKPELSSRARGFSGDFSETPNFTSDSTFRAEMDVAIPITEFRLSWTFRVTKILSLGLGANTSVWWDVPVPPGIIPIEGGDAVLHENTIALLGVSGAVVLSF